MLTVVVITIIVIPIQNGTAHLLRGEAVPGVRALAQRKRQLAGAGAWDNPVFAVVIHTGDVSEGHRTKSLA